MTDSSNMRQTILDFPKQFRAGLKTAEKTGLKRKFNSLIICGMGGSALGGNILKSWVKDRKLALPVKIHRDYGLPYWANKSSLIICVSYSGNTEETLSAFRQALIKKLPLVCLGSGGKLIDLCKKERIPFSLMPKGFQPRMALGLQFSSLLKIASNCGLVPGRTKELISLEKTLDPVSSENEGKRIAKILGNRIPVIYSSEANRHIAEIWKINFNENSKIPSFFNAFPEMNHNEMAGYSSKGKLTSFFRFLMLEDRDDKEKIRKRMELTAKTLGQDEVKIDIEGRNFFQKTFSAILMSYWASFHLALENKRDPSEMKIVEEFKKKLSR
jgi:glucose/mannose-6-phosphate isomerase